MTISYEKDESKDLTVFRISSEIRLDELIQGILDYFVSGFTRYEIYDVRDVGGEPFSAEDINKLVDFIVPRAGNYRIEGKTAIVASRDVDYGNFRMLAALTDIDTPYDIHVFRSIEEAYHWLELSPS